MSKLIQCFLNVGAVRLRITVKLRVTFELVFVENFERVVGLNQNVHVEVYEGEDAVFEGRRGVDVTVELEEPARGGLKAEDAVPAVSPEVLRAQSPRLDGADERVAHLFGEEGVEDDEGALKPLDARGPAAVDAAVVLARDRKSVV